MLAFEDGRVELLLVLGDAGERLRQLVASVDAFYLDGFAPARNPQMWAPGIFKALSRLAAPGATAATWSAARAVRDGLQQAGFEWRARRRHRRQAAHHARTSRRARRCASRSARTGDARGDAASPSSAAASRARRARRRSRARACSARVFDRHAQPAGAASGNVAGLFHGVFHPDDGMHARAHRAAALAAAPGVRARDRGRCRRASATAWCA